MTDKEINSLVLAACIQNLSNAAKNAAEYLDMLIINNCDKADPIAIDLTLSLKSAIKDLDEIFNQPSPLNENEEGESE